MRRRVGGEKLVHRPFYVKKGVILQMMALGNWQRSKLGTCNHLGVAHKSRQSWD